MKSIGLHMSSKHYFKSLVILLSMCFSLSVYAENCALVFNAVNPDGPSFAQEYANELSNMECEDYEDGASHDILLEGVHEIFYPEGWLDANNPDPLKLEIMVATRAAITDSLQALKTTPGIDSNSTFSTKVLVAADSIPGVGGDVSTAVVDQSTTTEFFENICAMYLSYKAIAPYSHQAIADYKQTIAHEIFHCYQGQVRELPKTNIDEWWYEGSANYFSHIVYPSNNKEHNVTGYYNAHLPLYEHNNESEGYSTVAFYLFLETVGESANLFREFSSFPETSNKREQQNELSSWNNINSHFQNFSVKFVDEQLKEISGVSIPIDRSTSRGETFSGPSEAGATREYDFSRKPFTVKVDVLTLTKGLVYDIEVDDNGISGLPLFKQGEDGHWSASLPKILRVECDQNKPIFILPTSTVSHDESNGQNYTLKLKITAHTSCACEYGELFAAEVDECLVGAWVGTDDSIKKRYLRGLDPKFTSYTGGVSLEISESGEFVKTNDLNITSKKNSKGGDAEETYTTDKGTVITRTPTTQSLGIIYNKMTEYSGAAYGCLSTEDVPENYPDLMKYEGGLIDRIVERKTGFRRTLGKRFEIDSTKEGTGPLGWPAMLEKVGSNQYRCNGNELSLDRMLYKRESK